VDFARFVAALIQARDWDLTAEIELRKGWRPLLFRLCSADGLRSRVLAPGLFDSAIGAAPVRKSLALQPGALPQAALLFKSRILLRDLLPRLEAFRRR